MEISDDVLNRIHAHLRATYPAEGCGFVLGHREGSGIRRVVEHHPVPNRRLPDGAAANRYLIGPEDYRVAERNAAEAGVQILGTYHSHPDAPAQPSPYDRDHAWPWYAYLIVSVRKGRVAEARVWELTEDRNSFVERDLRIVEQP